MYRRYLLAGALALAGCTGSSNRVPSASETGVLDIALDDDGKEWVRDDLRYRSRRLATTTTTVSRGGNWCLAHSSYGRQVQSGYGRGCCPQWEWAALAGGWSAAEWPTVSRLMYAESACDPNAYNPNNNAGYGHARGLLQVMDELWAPECGITFDQLFDPVLNAQCALLVWREQGFRAWITY